MKSIKKRAHTDDELITLYKYENFKMELFPAFQDYYKNAYEELYQDHKDCDDEEFEDDSIQGMTFGNTLRYFKKYVQLIENGHRKEWAHLIADSDEDMGRAFYDAYVKIKSKSAQQAKQELLTYCKSINADEYYIENFLYNFEEGDGIYNLEKKTSDYLKYYQKQLDLGKSKVYAHKFAWLLASAEFNEIYCEEYAYAYEKAIGEGKSIEYAEEYAERYGTAITDIKRRYGMTDDDDMLEFSEERVTGNMKAWEYANENRLSNIDRFIKIHESIYLNSYFPDEPKPDLSIEDFDKMIIEKALEEFDRKG